MNVNEKRIREYLPTLTQAAGFEAHIAASRYIQDVTALLDTIDALRADRVATEPEPEKE